MERRPMNFEFQAEAGRLWQMLSSRDQRRVRGGTKHFVGAQQRQGWSAPIPCYVFWCDACDRHTFDYPHGHIERQYLLCANCQAYHEFVPWWVPLRQTWELFRFLVTIPFSRSRVAR